jgi:hypothetical protein
LDLGGVVSRTGKQPFHSSGSTWHKAGVALEAGRSPLGPPILYA